MGLQGKRAARGAGIALAMIAVGWLPPAAEGSRAAGAQVPASLPVTRVGEAWHRRHAEWPRQDAFGPPPYREPGECARLREQLSRAAQAGRRLRVRALEEQWSDACR